MNFRVRVTIYGIELLEDKTLEAEWLSLLAMNDNLPANKTGRGMPCTCTSTLVYNIESTRT